MRIQHSFYIFLFLLFFFFSSAVQAQREKHQWFEISKFVDGDTFWIINGGGKPEKIRLIGVDAPEARRTGRKEIEHFGKEASAYVEKLLRGKRVRLEFDVSKYDRYKRTLAYVYLEDGTFLNAHLVKEGYATAMTVPPNVRFSELFVQLQREARQHRRGLWK
ncbi:thermonuclease family protein [Cecembia calidifontis]|uniref:Micrococcal nuclease n=1 Tax=Cecembia calidifontis TaxID=1187080 RepID=A0A4Q7PG29_9BACT|nr:thermonuclease family protein [Cecembia calidifontis]RZS97842.1 micrococcal nuclease [Cecembia calidifontis]